MLLNSKLIIAYITCNTGKENLELERKEIPVKIEFISGLTNAPSHLTLVFPSVENIRCCLEGYRGGGSVPYSRAVAHKQPWLNSFLHRWKSDNNQRSRACPHIKSYAAVTQLQVNNQSEKIFSI